MNAPISLRASVVISPKRSVPLAPEIEFKPNLAERPRVTGKFLYAGDEKLWVKGVTYGTFWPGSDGSQYGDPKVVDNDFAAMTANGINTVRTYTVPPRWLLDAAQRHGLRVMVSLAWEQHITFLDDRRRVKSIERGLGQALSECTRHPAILCYAIGNEIPAPIVRWHGARRIERFLKRLSQIVKTADPKGLVTYVNYPTTEYLQLPFLDLVCFNVYLESQDRLEAYLARLQNLAGERPLLLAEIGLDSRRNGEATQAQSLDWQIRTAFAVGCAGAIVFSWTDEWYRGGYNIEDWDFGLTTRSREPKPALSAVRKAFIEVPFPSDLTWPRISVVVCSFNGARTIRDTLEGLERLDYPNYEVIVVNDGSTDAMPEIAKEYHVRLISTENRGLSSARNNGWQAATGEIVAYIDDDAYPDPNWLHYLAVMYLNTEHQGVGGPNLAPPGDGPIADCVANAPGGPAHVLLSDTVAEHIPGCNMSFRKAALEAIGGFDPRFRAAGDDVDICWRIQEKGWTIGFSAAAIVWHHRRGSVGAYWRQQKGYGKAEALLEEKWPQRYNLLGHLSWAGRLYGRGLTVDLGSLRGRIYQGVWGSAYFQALYSPTPGTLWGLPLTSEWYLLLALLATLSLLGAEWQPLILFAPLFVVGLVLPIVQAVVSVRRTVFPSGPKTRWQILRLFTITAFLHLQQPLARLIGRLRHGLTPWRRRGHTVKWYLPATLSMSLWRERWQAPGETLEALRSSLNRAGAVVTTGGNYDAWDLEVRGGLFGAAYLLLGIEEHGEGKQLVRFRTSPRYSRVVVALVILFALVSVGSASGGAWVTSGFCGLNAVLIAACTLIDIGFAMGLLREALERLGASLR
jgi:O-antigen biosynthesis protein